MLSVTVVCGQQQGHQAPSCTQWLTGLSHVTMVTLPHMYTLIVCASAGRFTAHAFDVLRPLDALQDLQSDRPAFGEVVHAPPVVALKSKHWAAGNKQQQQPQQQQQQQHSGAHAAKGSSRKSRQKQGMPTQERAKVGTSGNARYEFVDVRAARSDLCPACRHHADCPPRIVPATHSVDKHLLGAASDHNYHHPHVGVSLEGLINRNPPRARVLYCKARSMDGSHAVCPTLQDPELDDVREQMIEMYRAGRPLPSGEPPCCQARPVCCHVSLAGNGLQ